MATGSLRKDDAAYTIDYGKVDNLKRRLAAKSLPFAESNMLTDEEFKERLKKNKLFDTLMTSTRR